MSMFPWERDPNDEFAQAAYEITEMRRQAVRNLIELVATGIRQQGFTAAKAEYEQFVSSYVWDLAVIVAQGLQALDEIPFWELDGDVPQE